MSNLTGQVIAITVAASGIGLKTSHRTFYLGAKLSLCDINPENLVRMRDSLLAAHPSRAAADIFIRRVDVSANDDIEAWVSETVRTFGQLDAAVNVAGVGFSNTPLRDMSDDEWHGTMNVNLNGVFYSMRAELRVMREEARIVNIASSASVIAVPRCSAYGAAKRAIIGLTTIAAHEESTRGIRINAVAPGYIESPMTDGAPEATKAALLARAKAQTIPRVGQLRDVSRVVVFLLGQDSDFVTGRTIVVDGGSISAV